VKLNRQFHPTPVVSAVAFGFRLRRPTLPLQGRVGASGEACTDANRPRHALARIPARAETARLRKLAGIGCCPGHLPEFTRCSRRRFGASMAMVSDRQAAIPTPRPGLGGGAAAFPFSAAPSFPASRVSKPVASRLANSNHLSLTAHRERDVRARRQSAGTIVFLPKTLQDMSLFDAIDDADGIAGSGNRGA
jgi:hypothetical protein